MIQSITFSIYITIRKSLNSKYNQVDQFVNYSVNNENLDNELETLQKLFNFFEDAIEKM